MLAIALALSLQTKFSFFSFDPYDKAIPNPEQTLGYRIGDRTTTFRDQERAVLGIAEAAGKRAKVIQYGKSWEGRPLRIIAVSSPENMARLDEIRKNNHDRAEGKSVALGDPAIIWINECIHGDETASFESAMPLLYNLTASRSASITNLLRNAVVIVNPVYNPDGHERFTVYYNSIAVGSSDPNAFERQEPSAIYGRTNHYRFDMNRDRIAMSQIETQQEVGMFLRWHPQVYVDQHGQVETYFFPPNSMSQNANVDRERVNKWTDIFGRATGKAFDQNGFSFFIGDTFDLYYPGYLDSFTTLSGAIGMTQETDGGRVLKSQRADGSTLTLRDGIAHHFTAALAVIGAAAEQKDDLIRSFISYRVATLFPKVKRAVVAVGTASEVKAMAAQLSKMGIYSWTGKRAMAFSNARDLWQSGGQIPSGEEWKIFIPYAQPQGTLAKAMLEPTSDFEPDFIKNQLAKKAKAPEGETYPGPEGADFYDVTGWSIPLAHNLQAWEVDDTTRLDWKSMLVQDNGESVSKDVSINGSVLAIPYKDEQTIIAIARLQAEGLKVSVTTKEMKLNGRSFPPGTFLVFRSRNSDALIAKCAVSFDEVDGLESSYPESGSQGPGSESVTALQKPKIGIVFGNGANLGDVGGIWFAMDQEFRLPFTPLSTAALNRNLDGYTCIVVPSGTGFNGNAKLKEWVQAGGCLVVLGDADWTIGSNGFGSLSEVEGDHRDLPGSIFKAELDQRSFLSYGYKSSTIAVPVVGSTFYKRRKEGGSVVRFSNDDKTKKLLTGWEWPDETEKALSGTVWLQDFNTGRGHAIVFTFDPTDRAMWPGLHKLLLNSMYLGPNL